MKKQIRRGVFETNSSATHSLTLYKKEEWEKIKNGEGVIDESWFPDKNEKFNTKEDVKNSKEFKQFLKNEYDEETVKSWDDDEMDEAVLEFMHEEGIYDYETYTEEYEVLTEEVPDSDYVAVSIFSYE